MQLEYGKGEGMEDCQEGVNGEDTLMPCRR